MHRRCGAWESDPPRPARRAGALPESELRRIGSQERSCTSTSRWTLRSDRSASAVPPPGQELLRTVRPAGIEPARPGYQPEQGNHPVQSRFGAGRENRTHLVLLVGQMHSQSTSPAVSRVCRRPRRPLAGPSCRRGLVGVSGLEPPLSYSRSTRFRQTNLHPDTSSIPMSPITVA